MLLRQPVRQRHERRRAHPVDVGERAARIRREPETEDRADIRLARIGDHPLLHGARRFQRLRDEQPLPDLLRVEIVAWLRRENLRQPRPQALLAPGVVVEALAVLAPEPLAPLHHVVEQLLLPRIDGLLAEVGLRRLEDFPGEVDADLVGQRQRPDRHAGGTRHVLDHRRRNAFGEHPVPFEQIRHHAAVGVEAAEVVDDDRRLPDGAHIVERQRQRLVAGLLAHDDLDQHHPVHRREEVDADEAFLGRGRFSPAT